MTRRRPDHVKLAPVPATDPVSELVDGRPGTPTPTEREKVYVEVLRQGKPRTGWIAQRAREWGIDATLVGRELAAAQQELDTARQPEACQVLAHELTIQAIELANEVEALARTPVERETVRDMTGEELAALVEARAKAMTEQSKALGLAATLKLKAAASLLAIHRKPAGSVQVNLGGQASGAPGLGAALKGTP